LEHVPVAGSHVPASWQWSAALQTTGWLPVHVPLSHASVCVHASPSLHAVPSGLAGFEHVPVAGSHVPATWHWSWAVQVTGLLPVHVPFSHESVRVQALPSLHAVPLAFGGLEQPTPAVQTSSVQMLPSLQSALFGVPAQPPPVHTSVTVQATPSSQAVPLDLAGCVQAGAPTVPLHTSLVHTLPSSVQLVPAAWTVSAGQLVLWGARAMSWPMVAVFPVEAF